VLAVPGRLEIAESGGVNRRAKLPAIGVQN
jgi:hypothetical protein